MRRSKHLLRGLRHRAPHVLQRDPHHRGGYEIPRGWKMEHRRWLKRLVKGRQAAAYARGGAS